MSCDIAVSAAGAGHGCFYGWFVSAHSAVSYGNRVAESGCFVG